MYWLSSLVGWDEQESNRYGLVSKHTLLSEYIKLLIINLTNLEFWPPYELWFDKCLQKKMQISVQWSEY